MFTVSDLDHRYILTHLVDERLREVTEFGRPIVVYGRETITRQQVEKLDWRSMYDGIQNSKNVVVGEEVPAPPPDFPLRAFYYRSEMSGWKNQK